MKQKYLILTAALFLCGCGSADSPAESPVPETATATTEATREPETTAIDTVATTEDSDGSIFDYIKKPVNYYYTWHGRAAAANVVFGKHTAEIEVTAIAEDLDGNVIGKEVDTVYVLKGEYNAFIFHFDSEHPSNVTYSFTGMLASPVREMPGKAVEEVASNRVEDKLYITVRQIQDEMPAFAGYRLLFFKNGKAVHDTEGYYYTETNLMYKDDEDVLKIDLPHDFEYDNYELYYEIE